MNDNYQFTVIIPTHNRSDFLKQAISSVLEQKDVSVQIVVVDDASTDDTPQAIAQLKSENPCIEYIRNEHNAFAHGARRIGYRKATGSYIIFMDDDDFYIDANFFADVKKAFEKNPTTSAVIGSTITFHDNDFGDSVNLNGEGLIDNLSYFNGFLSVFQKPFSTLTAAFRKQCLDELNLNESKMVNDTCIYLYGILLGDIFLINKPVAAYRIHSSNISKGHFSMDFIINTLEEKVKIYNLALHSNKLNNRKCWLFFQLNISVDYFVSNAVFDPVCFFRIAMWILIHGHGTQMKFLKTYLSCFPRLINYIKLKF